MGEIIHRSGFVYSHARERSIAQKLRNLTRGNGPLLKNWKIPRAGTVHHSGIGKSHTRDRSTARELQNPTRGSSPSPRDRKSTRLNSSHVAISYAVFCLKKK